MESAVRTLLYHPAVGRLVTEAEAAEIRAKIEASRISDLDAEFEAMYAKKEAESAAKSPEAVARRKAEVAEKLKGLKCPVCRMARRLCADPEGHARPEAVEAAKAEAAKKKAGGLSATIRRMRLAGEPMAAIEDAAVAHPKYQGREKRARAYARMFVKHYVDEGR